MQSNNDMKIMARSSQGDIAGTYEYKIYVTALEDVYEAPYFVEFPEHLKIIVLSTELTFQEVVSLVTDSLTVKDVIPIESPIVMNLDPIVAGLGLAPYEDYNITVAAKDSMYDDYIQFSLTSAILNLGPFPQELADLDVMIQIILSINNSEQ